MIEQPSADATFNTFSLPRNVSRSLFAQPLRRRPGYAAEADHGRPKTSAVSGSPTRPSKAPSSGSAACLKRSGMLRPATSTNCPRFTAPCWAPGCRSSDLDRHRSDDGGVAGYSEERLGWFRLRARFVEQRETGPPKASSSIAAVSSLKLVHASRAGDWRDDRGLRHEPRDRNRRQGLRRSRLAISSKASSTRIPLPSR